MAEEFGQAKTEAPTEHRREEARQQGRVAYSTEFSAGLMLLAAVAALWLGSKAFAGGLQEILRQGVRDARPQELSAEQASALLTSLMGRGLELIGAFLGLLFAVAFGAGVLQAGFRMTPGQLGPRWDKLSIVEGWSRIFSLTALMRGLMAVVKVSVVAVIAFWVLKGKGTQIAVVGQCSLGAATAQGWELALRLALAIAAALLMVGLADYCFQRWRHEQSLWMTKQELKDESKREEGDPMIKARIRKLQREAARKQMMRDVPRATVVLTNPTHLAVAIRYERGKMKAPQVIAKGAGFVAQRIVALARRHAVPVVERKPLAQALFKTVRVGQEIPAALYVVVAEILAYVYRLRGSVGVEV
jgi:flagellar biosynthesis protein FlhB